MDLPALSCGRLHSALRAGATGADLGGDLRELLVLDDEMWAEDDMETPPPGQPRRGAAAPAEAGAYAPAGLRESALPLAGLEEEHSAAAECADGGNARVCAHPLWPVLVDYYFACRKARALRRDGCAASRDGAPGRACEATSPAVASLSTRAALTLAPSGGRRWARPTAPPSAPSTASARSWRSACRRCVSRQQPSRRVMIPSVTSEATCAAPLPPAAQLNATAGRAPYIMGTDPELDAFLVRALAPSQSQNPNAVVSRHPASRPPPLAAAARPLGNGAARGDSGLALTWRCSAAQRAYVKELEVLKAELEHILSAVRPPCFAIARALCFARWHCQVLCDAMGLSCVWPAPPVRQTDDICADFEKRLKAIVPSVNGGGGTGRGPAGSALAACAVAQAQTGSLILAATGALRGFLPFARRAR